jgi:peptide/nickel transport system permease protein
MFRGTKFRVSGKLGFGLIVVGLLIAGAVFADQIGHVDPIHQDYGAMLQAPSRLHLLGTDLLGRDVLARVLHGARISLLISVGSVALMILIGMPLGAAAGYFGGWIDGIIMRAADVLLAFPFILGAIAMMAAIGPGALNVFLALAFLGWPEVARVTRASVIDETGKDYIAAAKVAGGSSWYILRRHLLPNAAAPVLVLSFMEIGTAILTEATLSFLGLGIQVPRPAWGTMLADAAGRLNTAPWLLIVPGAAIILACLGFNMIGESLSDALENDG